MRDTQARQERRSDARKGEILASADWERLRSDLANMKDLSMEAQGALQDGDKTDVQESLENIEALATMYLRGSGSDV